MYAAGGVAAVIALGAAGASALGLADTALVRIGSRISVLGTDVSGGSKIYGSTLAEAGEPRVTNWRIIHE